MEGTRIKLGIQGVAAAWFLLQQAKPKGRADVRRHARAFVALQNGCGEPKKDPNTGEVDKTAFDFKDGEWVLSPIEHEYVSDLLDERLQTEIEGFRAIGFAELIEALPEPKG